MQVAQAEHLRQHLRWVDMPPAAQAELLRQSETAAAATTTMTSEELARREALADPEIAARALHSGNARVRLGSALEVSERRRAPEAW